ncbi:MAG: 3-oxoadipyl-CoA thiolase [Acidobacteriota bacterium]
MSEAYIIDGVRTPIGNHGGALATVRPDDLAAHVLQSLLARHPQVDAALIDDVILGNANGAGEENRNVARMASLLAGLPESVPGVSLNRLCASGLSAVISAAQAIKSGDGELYLAGGVESMTRAPFVMAKSDSAWSRTAEVFDTSIGWRFVNPRMKERFGVDSMGETAENVAQETAVGRNDQDLFAAASQRKAAAARAAGRFGLEIAPVPVPQRKGEPLVFSHDEFIKPETTVDVLSKLRAAFRKDGTVTAGNASGINDGAAALIVASESMVKRFGLTPKARVLAAAAAGVAPRVMGLGPVAAVKRVLAKAQMTLDQVDLIEINEAFAAQVLADLRLLGIADDDPRVNPNGGAIALGHPLGMSGARLALTAAIELERRDLHVALVSMCVGVGQGVALLIAR